MDPDPISFKRINTSQYYSSDFNHRVDSKYTESQKQKMSNFDDQNKQYQFFKSSNQQGNYMSETEKKKKKKDKDNKEKE